MASSTNREMVERLDKPLWDKYIIRWRNQATGLFTAVNEHMIHNLLDETVKTAQHHLDVMVYNAPLPRSAETHPNYFSTRRRGRARASVKQKMTGKGSGVAYVDRADYPGYFYALSLEFGLSRWPAYHARPFWSATRATMEVKLRTHGELAIRELRNAFRI